MAAAVDVAAAAGGEGIQQALDRVGAGGQVVLSRGTYIIHEPIILCQNGQTLRGAGPATILCLADGANCPVVILGAPLRKGKGPIRGLRLCDLLVDGNRAGQQKEVWRWLPDGAGLYNNGVGVWNADDCTVEHVVCCHCRSGGLVSSQRTRRLKVLDYSAYDNQFDGLACYLTEESHFSRLDLHDNLAAGISLDLDFNHNVIEGAVLSGNDLGVFMRQSRDNVFAGVTIRNSRHDGVFMAQSGEATRAGWRLSPGTECTGNSFNSLRVSGCGGRGFQVNNDSCTNNFINGGQFVDNAQGGLCQAATNPVTLRAGPERPVSPLSLNRTFSSIGQP
jgi:hypothetical protein